MPNVDHQPLVDRVEQAAKKLGLEFEYVDKTPPLIISPNASCVRFLSAITGNGKPRTVCYATDGGVLRRLNQLVVCGPGDIAQAHTKDEWIEVDQLQKAAEIYYRFCSE